MIGTWQVFLIIGILLSAAEVWVPGFVVLPMGLGFILAAAAAPFIPTMAGDFVALAVCLGIVFLVFRKFIRFSGKGADHRSGVDGLIGKSARVSEGIDNLQKNGAIKIYSDVLRASSDNGQNIAEGSEVIIVKIDGNRAIVRVSSTASQKES